MRHDQRQFRVPQQNALDARDASDLIAKLSGKAYWRKLFVRTDVASVDEARAICADLIATGGHPRLW